MILTYTITVVIIGAWLLKMINQKSLSIKRTPLDIPLLLFLGANILSTIFSIDRHTSIWGYYSRSNGGLLSLISYLLLYWAFVSNMGREQVKNVLRFGLISGFIISLWAILEHFGVSLSCILLRGEFNASCWVQDVQARVFATLGQPNWLAAYLAMLIFPTLYFLLTATTKFTRITYYILLITFYLAFTFTYSRGPTLGLIGGLVIFIILYFFQKYSENSENQRVRKSENQKFRLSDFLVNPILRVILIFLAINLFFGSALTSFRLVSKFAAPARPSISLPSAPSVGTQLENGGTESGQIRFIVWKGALDIFKNNPIFGTGLETFAYSYYQYRPVSHNMTSEWDFLYNKAHNEYLNYLATTGIVGIGTYMLMIGVFIFWCIKRIMNKELRIKLDSSFLLLTALLASYVSFLIYNFFLFSVVIIAIFFYLFPALVFVSTGSTKDFKFPSNLRFLSSIFQKIYQKKSYIKIVKGLILFSVLYLLYSIFQLWYADILFSKGNRASDAGNPARAYNFLSAASGLNKGEPFYHSELAFASAEVAASLGESDATLSAALKEEADIQMQTVLRSSPKNVSFLRTAIRTYFELSTIDRSYIDKTLETIDSAIKLAPTDPKLYYNKALVLQAIGRKNESIKALQQAVALKSNYLEAKAELKDATESGKTK